MKILELELQSSDLDPLRYFYHEVLGLDLLENTSERFSLYAGHSVLRFREASDGTQPHYHFAFNIPENQIEDALSWLQARDIQPLPFEGNPIVHFEDWDAHAVYFLDPSGNIVELIARHELNNANHSPFGVDHLQGISEVGMPTDQVEPLAALIQERLGINPWSRSKPSARFTAMGDAEGLFILVREPRNWFPTEVPSKPHPVFVTVEGPWNVILQDPTRQFIIESRHSGSAD